MAVEKGTMTQEQREAISARMKKFHRNKRKAKKVKGNGLIRRAYKPRVNSKATQQKFNVIDAREEVEASLAIVDAMEALRPTIRTNVLGFIARHFRQ